MQSVLAYHLRHDVPETMRVLIVLSVTRILRQSVVHCSDLDTHNASFFAIY